MIRSNPIMPLIQIEISSLIYHNQITAFIQKTHYEVHHIHTHSTPPKSSTFRFLDSSTLQLPNPPILNFNTRSPLPLPLPLQLFSFRSHLLSSKPPPPSLQTPLNRFQNPIIHARYCEKAKEAAEEALSIVFYSIPSHPIPSTSSNPINPYIKTRNQPNTKTNQNQSTNP